MKYTISYPSSEIFIPLVKMIYQLNISCKDDGENMIITEDSRQEHIAVA